MRTPTFLLCTVLCFLFEGFSSCKVDASSYQDLGKKSVLEVLPLQYYKDDLQQLKKLIVEKHPAVFEFISSAEFDNNYKMILSSLTDSTTIGEFAWKARQLIGLVGCGHSYIPTLGESLYMPDELQFPIQAEYFGDSLIVMNSYANSVVVPRGTQILKVNGVSVTVLKERMRLGVSADAYINTFRDRLVNRNLPLYLAFELGFPPKFDITVLVDNEQYEIRSLAPVSLDISSNPTNNVCQEMCYSFDGKFKISRIGIPSFNYYRDDLRTFTNFIDGAFAQMQNDQPSHLIIDIRDNGGGSPHASSYLLRHLIKKPFVYYQANTSFYDDLKLAQEPINITGDSEIYLVVNGSCFSTSGHFTALFQDHEIGKIVGEELGANYSCNAATEGFRLKNTGISGSIARMSFSVDVDNTDHTHGIMPDISVENISTARLSGRDLHVERVISIIRNID